jgi:hypothetical protein
MLLFVKDFESSVKMSVKYLKKNHNRQLNKIFLIKKQAIAVFI